MRGEVGALERTGIRAFPDVLVTLWIKLEIELPLLFKLGREPGLSLQFAFTTIALSGFLALRKSSTASLLRLGFQLAQI
jgi:hypothetical protein